MAHVWMMSFHWEGFETLVAPPATELAQRIVRSVKNWHDLPEYMSSHLPTGDSDLVSHFAGLFAAQNWYDGKSYNESSLMDYLVDCVFDRSGPKALKLKPLGKEGGILLECLELATGRAEVDVSRRKRRNDFYIKATGRENRDVPELLSLGCRPHRHRSWDRKATEQLLKKHSQFQRDTQRVYCPDYSIHSPEQVKCLLTELSSVRDAFRDVPDDLMVHIEDELYQPIETAALRKRAIFARGDH